MKRAKEEQQSPETLVFGRRPKLVGCTRKPPFSREVNGEKSPSLSLYPLVTPFPIMAFNVLLLVGTVVLACGLSTRLESRMETNLVYSSRLCSKFSSFALQVLS